MDCLSCWDIHLSSNNTKSSRTRFIQKSKYFISSYWVPHTGHKCRIPKLKLYRSQNHTSPCGQGHCFWKYSPWTIHPDNEIVFAIMFHLRKGMLWVRLALSPVCVDCLLSTLRPDVLACWERDSYILQMEQNNKIPSISISDRPIQFILPWRKFV